MKDKFTDIMLDLIPQWKTLDLIIDDLASKYDYFIDGRSLRKYIANYNEEYQAHLTDGYYIAHSCKGYKITKNHEEMKKSDIDLKKRLIKLSKIIRKNAKARGEDDNECMNEVIEQIKKTDTAISIS